MQRGGQQDYKLGHMLTKLINMITGYNWPQSRIQGVLGCTVLYGATHCTYLSCAADHDVVTVAVSDAQDIGGHAVACTRQREFLYGPLQSITIHNQHRDSKILPVKYVYPSANGRTVAGGTNLLARVVIIRHEAGENKKWRWHFLSLINQSTDFGFKMSWQVCLMHSTKVLPYPEFFSLSQLRRASLLKAAAAATLLLVN